MHENVSHQMGGAIFRELAQRFNCQVFEHRYGNDVATIEQAFQIIQRPLVALIEEYLVRRRIARYKLVLDIEIEKTNGEQLIMPLRTNARKLFLADKSYIDEYILEDKAELLTRQDSALAETGSRESIIGISAIRVELNQCDIFGGADNDDLPFFNGKEHIVNPVTDGQSCFFNALAIGLGGENKLEQLMSFRDKHFRPAKGEKFIDGMKLSKVRFFEKRNAHLNVGINIFLQEDATRCYPVYRSIHRDKKPKNSLLLVRINENLYHYTFLKDLSSFIKHQKSHRDREYCQSCHACQNCLLTFSSEQNLKDHQELCFANKTQKISMPEFLEKTELKNSHKKYGYPIIGFADFEAVLSPEDRSKSNCKNCQKGGRARECNHNTHVVNNHKPVCFSLVFVDDTNRILFSRAGASKNGIMDEFFQSCQRS